MPKKKKIEDLDKRLDILMMEDKSEVMKKLCEIEICNEFNPWTPLKLIALSYFTGPYLRIIGSLKNRYGGNLFVAYIDVFSGSGINKLNDSYMVGSPIVAIDSANTARCKFDAIYLADINKTYVQALHKRLKMLEEHEEYAWIKNRYKIYERDASDALLEIVNELNQIQYKNYLAFIDPYKWEMEWFSLKELLKIRGDLLITHQARLIAKEIGKYNTGGLTEEKAEEITKYLGIPHNEWKKLNKEEKVKEFYIGRIKKYKKFVKEWTVKSGKGYRYYLIFASSQKDPKWKSIIDNLSRFETFSGDLVQRCLERMKGRAFRITDFS